MHLGSRATLQQRPEERSRDARLQPPPPRERGVCVCGGAQRTLTVGDLGPGRPGHCREPPPCPLAWHFSLKKVARHTCRRCVCDASVEPLQSPAAPPASRDEVAANGRWPRGSLADQVSPCLKLLLRRTVRSPDTLQVCWGSRVCPSNLRGNGSACSLLLGVFTRVFS